MAYICDHRNVWCVTLGLFGVGGGIACVPALICWAGFLQLKATGFSLVVLLLPIGLAATLEYYRNGNFDLMAAIILAASMIIGDWNGAFLANQMKGPPLRLIFGVFVSGVGVCFVYGGLPQTKNLLAILHSCFCFLHMP